MNKDELRVVLRNSNQHEWEVQGFGMLRTYLGGPFETRLQIWDPRLQVWGNNAVHDHPWDFGSQIIVGTIFNQRFDLQDWSEEQDGPLSPDDPRVYSMVEINPGIGGGVTGEPQKVSLWPQPVEVYQCGDEYSQKAHELHVTRYEPGTVTVLNRYNRSESNIAHSCWKGSADWNFYEPRPATGVEIGLVVRRTIDKWWL